MTPHPFFALLLMCLTPAACANPDAQAAKAAAVNGGAGERLQARLDEVQRRLREVHPEAIYECGHKKGEAHGLRPAGEADVAAAANSDGLNGAAAITQAKVDALEARVETAVAAPKN